MKKLNLHQVEKELFAKNIKIFTPQDLSVMFGAGKRAVGGFLGYNVKKQAFVQLKKTLYSLRNDLPSEFVLANRIYSPSYISLDSALAYYHLIPETVYSVTSVTSKAAREFEAIGRSFEYHKIKKSAYAGYLPKLIDEEVVFIATPEKAAADFLYFVWLGRRDFNDRLRWENIDRVKLEKYLRLFGQKRLISFVRKLQ
ncbi:MAG: hypothetical protein ABIH88_02525 [Patescibacteria group bacterium]|nr:hypothetical protein [Patescibacteria group bacterium]